MSKKATPPPGVALSDFFKGKNLLAKK